MEGSNERAVPAIPSLDEMKKTVVQYGEINGELKKLQERLKELRGRKEMLSSTIKEFMSTNDLYTCRISKDVNTTIKRINFIEREQKERITVKMVEEMFGEFFSSVDNVRFLGLSNEEKAEAFFEFLESKRKKRTLKSITIR